MEFFADVLVAMSSATFRRSRAAASHPSHTSPILTSWTRISSKRDRYAAV